MKWLLPFVFLFVCLVSGAQTGKYAVVDSFIKSLRLTVDTEDDLKILIDKIKVKFSMEEERVRAAYYWVTENIAYDAKGYYSGEGMIGSAQGALKYKRAVCAGYSDLLDHFFRGMGLQSKYITGVARCNKEDFVLHPDSLVSSHAWNAVKIDGEWKLMDATWAAGVLRGGGFSKERRDQYFLMHPGIFIYEHLPDDSRWQFLPDTVISQETFCSLPFLGYDFEKAAILKIKPFEQRIRGIENQLIHFSFTSAKKINRASLITEDGRELESWIVNPVNGVYRISYRLKYAGVIKVYLGFEYARETTKETSWSAPYALGYLLIISAPGESLLSH